MNKFQQDLKEGQKYEDYFASFIGGNVITPHTRYGDVEKNGKIYEVKRDRMFDETGNIAVEMMSGVAEPAARRHPTKVDYLIYFVGGYIYQVDRKRLIDLAEITGTVSMGDGGRVQGILINKRILSQISIRRGRY